MDVQNEVGPTSPERIAEMMQPGPDGPVHMVNLLRFRERAEYEDGRPTDLSGREAYGLYAEVTSKLIEEFDGSVAFQGEVTFLALGQVEDLWDEVVIATYPNRGAMVQMSMSDTWQEANVHRVAGLSGQLNIETVVPAETW